MSTIPVVTLGLETLGVDRDPEGWQHNAYRATLRYQGRQMTVPYKTGLGWDRDPTATDVLECLLSDACGYDNAQGFEDWASEYAFDVSDPDARKRAEKTYRAVKEQTRNLRRLLGDEYDAAVFPEHEDSEQVAARLTGTA